MKRILLALGVIYLALCGTAILAEEIPVREKILFNADWTFKKGDPADAKGVCSYDKLKSWLLPQGNPFRQSPHRPAARCIAGAVGESGDLPGIGQEVPLRRRR